MARKRNSAAQRATVAEITAFAAKFHPLLQALNNDMDSLDSLDLDSDIHLATADMAARAQALVVQFYDEAGELKIPEEHQASHNTFVLAEATKAFVFSFCDEWQEMRNEGLEEMGFPRNTRWMIELNSKIGAIVSINRTMNADRVRQKSRPITNPHAQKQKRVTRKRKQPQDEKEASEDEEAITEEDESYAEDDMKQDSKRLPKRQRKDVTEQEFDDDEEIEVEEMKDNKDFGGDFKPRGK